MAKIDKSFFGNLARLPRLWLAVLSMALVFGLFTGFCWFVYERSRIRGEHLLWLAETMTPLVKDGWKQDLPTAMHQLDEVDQFLTTYAESSFTTSQWVMGYNECIVTGTRIQRFIADELNTMLREVSPQDLQQRLEQLQQDASEKGLSRKLLGQAFAINASRLAKAGVDNAK